MEIRNLLTALLAGSVSLSHASLEPMTDEALDEMVGQAYIEMNSFDDTDGHQVSRITFGQTVKIQANADELTLGNGGINGAGTADIGASDFSLGYIDITNQEIVPFVGTNPYIEWATDTNNNIVGFRMGFEEAQGIIQMDLTSFSGNINMRGTQTYLHNGFGTGTAVSNRGTHLGTNSTDCNSGTDCMDLASLQSLSIANPDGSGTAANDFFMSFQTLASKSWRLAGGSDQAASQGFFMNLPTDNTFDPAGTQGFTTEFIDRGVGRWHE